MSCTYIIRVGHAFKRPIFRSTEATACRHCVTKSRNDWLNNDNGQACMMLSNLYLITHNFMWQPHERDEFWIKSKPF